MEELVYEAEESKLYIQQAMRSAKVSEQRYNMMRTLSQEDNMGIHEEDVKGIKLLDYYGTMEQETTCTLEACAGIQQLLIRLLSVIVQVHAI